MNVHDELMCSTHPSVVTQVTEKVRTVVESYRDKVPLIGMSWFQDMANWAEKKDGAEKDQNPCPRDDVVAMTIFKVQTYSECSFGL